MTEVEKRRAELLEQTRKRYQERYAPPAIHPRYQGTYHSLYMKEGEEANGKSTIGIRLVFAIACLVLFISLYHSDNKMSEKVLETISENQFIEWLNLPMD